MPTPLQKKYALDINQKLYENETLFGKLAVYQSTTLGLLLTINDNIILSQADGFFYYEMISHPSLFMHACPQTIVVTGYYHGILQEIVKHPTVQTIHCVSPNSIPDDIIETYFADLKLPQQDKRIQFHPLSHSDWLKQQEAESVDIIIHAAIDANEIDPQYHRILRQDGMLVQSCSSSIMAFNAFKPTMNDLQQTDFTDWQLLHFPQPSFPTGSRTIMIANKSPIIRRIREQDIYNRDFMTRYYNFDVHKAAFALPEFIRKEWEL